MAPKAKTAAKAKAKVKAQTQTSAIDKPCIAESTETSNHIQFASGTKEELKSLFTKYDTNLNGVLELEELQLLLNAIGSDIPESTIAKLFQTMDKNKNGVLSFDEFLDCLFVDTEGKEKVGNAFTKASASTKLPEQAINKQIADELRCLADPSKPVQLVLELVAVLLSVPYENVVSAQKMLSSRNWVNDVKGLRDRLRAGELPGEVLQKAEKVRQRLLTEYDEVRITKSSKAASFLWVWAVSILEEGAASSETTDLRGHELSAPSVHHLSGSLLETLASKGFEASSKVYEIEEKVIRGQGRDRICPRDGKLGAAYVDSVGKHPDDIGLASHMLSYSWGYKVSEIVETLEKFFVGSNTQRSYVWICCFCVNQHRVQEKHEKLPFHFFEHIFHDRVSKIGSVIAMMTPWSAPLYIRRVWCDFELYTATAKNTAVVHIAMPPKEEESFVHALRHGDGIKEMWQTLASLNVETAEATEAEDRKNILGLIEKRPGFKEFNNIVAKLLQTWIVNTSESFLMKALEDMESGTAKCFEQFQDLTCFMLQVGDLFGKIGNGNKSICWYTRALKLIEEDDRLKRFLQPALTALSTMKYDMGLKEEAELLRQRSRGLTDFDSSSSKDWYEQGMGKLKNKQLEGALHDFEHSLTLEMGSYSVDKQFILEANNSIGGVKAQLGDSDGSEVAFVRAVDLLDELGIAKTPKAAQIWLNLGNTRAQKKEIASAKDCFNRALEIHKMMNTLEGMHGAKLLLNMAVTLWNSCDLDGAAEKADISIKTMEDTGMVESDFYTRAKEVANGVSKQRARLDKLRMALPSFQQSIAKIDAMMKHEGIPSETTEAMGIWHARLKEMLSIIESGITDARLQVPLDDFNKFRDDSENRIGQLQAMIESSEAQQP